jgi:hypothetical protein
LGCHRTYKLIGDHQRYPGEDANHE